jgi:hypothetical protein
VTRIPLAILAPPGTASTISNDSLSQRGRFRQF